MRAEAGGNAPPRDRRGGRFSHAAVRAAVRAAARAAALAAAGAAVGCANPFSPEGDDVGVYKGERDPLMEEPAADRREALRERFDIIQSR